MKNAKKGQLFIIATPIGNLKDITYRAVEVLNFVDAILCEDTRYTIRLLQKYNISKKLVSYHKFSDEKKIVSILDLLEAGQNLALVSDAGTPLIADPGDKLVKFLLDKGIKIEAIPGACSVINALVSSNFDLNNFVFAGWMPKKNKQKIEGLKEFLTISNTVVFLESPHRIQKTIQHIHDVLQENNDEMLDKLQVCIAREMTKMHEEILRKSLVEMKNFLTKKENIKGEIVLIFSLLKKQEKNGNSRDKIFKV